MQAKTILKKIIQVGSTTLVSRCLGVVRELLTVRFLGAGLVSDAFITAYKVPNSLRKVFAEGALSAAFVPSFIAALKDDKKKAEQLLSFSFVVFEGALLFLCGIAMLFAPTFLRLIAWGFTEEKILVTATFFRILMPFIFFISSSALLAGALQSVNRFFVPACGPILLNLVFIMGLFFCLFFKLPVTYLCFFILFGGFLQFLLHLCAYYNAGFSLRMVEAHTRNAFSHMLIKFLLTGLSMGAMEFSLFLDTSFASYLPDGTVSLIYYANRFMGIPMGVFGAAFATILLPVFSRISTYAPRRLNFFLHESAKLIFWVTIPCMAGLIFFADDFFITFFVPRMTMAQAHEGGNLLIAFAVGLFFFTFNKVLLNFFYSLHCTTIPLIVTVIGTLVNILFNLLLMHFFGGVGLVVATTVAGAVQTLLLLHFLKEKYQYAGYPRLFGIFVARYMLQLCVAGALFFPPYFLIKMGIRYLLSPSLGAFFLYKIGFWIWVLPLCLGAWLFLYIYRKKFGVSVYFLD